MKNKLLIFLYYQEMNCRLNRLKKLNILRLKTL
jgi:hypothetical protein